MILPKQIDASTLFKDWVCLSNDKGIQAEFNHYELLELENGDWVDVDNRAAKEAEHRNLKKYASGEFLAHELPYRSLPDLSIQRILEEEGTYRDYQCTRLSVNHEGLVGYVLTPLLVDGRSADVKVVFRGTKPNSSASCKRNLEVGGAGSVSFAANRDAILAQVNQAIREFNQSVNLNGKPINLVIGGHSLGGADASNFFTEMLQAFSQNHGMLETNPHAYIDRNLCDQFNAIQKLRLFTYNSTGAREDSDFRTTQLATYLASVGASVDIEVNDVLVVGDGIQQTGKANVLSNVSKDIATVNVLKANIGYGHRHKFSLPAAVATMGVGAIAGGVVGAGVATAAVCASAGMGVYDTIHTHTKHLCKEPMKVQYQSFSNATPEGQAQVHKELNKKSSCLSVIHKAAALLIGFERHKAEVLSAPVLPSAMTQAFAERIASVGPKKPWYRAWF